MSSLMAVMGFSLCANGGVLCFFVGVLCFGVAVGWSIGGWPRH